MACHTAGGDNGAGTHPNNAQKMVKDAIVAADPCVDSRDSDNDCDGHVDPSLAAGPVRSAGPRSK